MMAIFSEENVAQILLLALSNDVSNLLKNKVFNLSARYSAYSEIAAMVGSKSWTIAGVKNTFIGYTSHGTIAYGMSKGLSPAHIKTILNNGTTRIVTHARWGDQLYVQYQGKAIVIDIAGGMNHGEIITYLLNP